MTTKTELELIREAQAGSTKAANKLCKMHIGFVKNCAAHYAIKDLEHADIVQLCYLGLLDAIRDYKEETGFKLISYAAYKIRGRIHRECSGKMKMKRCADVCSLDAHFQASDDYGGDSGDFGLINKLKVDHEFYTEDCFKLCKDVIETSSLPEKKKGIMRAILFKCEHDLEIQFREVAKDFDLTHQRIYQIMQSVAKEPRFQKLKRELIELTTG